MDPIHRNPLGLSGKRAHPAGNKISPRWELVLCPLGTTGQSLSSGWRARLWRFCLKSVTNPLVFCLSWGFLFFWVAGVLLLSGISRIFEAKPVDVMFKLKSLLIVSALATVSLCGVAQTRVIAHRGYWDTENSAQNSLSALRLADSLGVYGSEFDVQMTADGKLIVNHDDSIPGYNIFRTRYSRLKKVRLANGEPIPTLQAYLEEGKKLTTRLILELKPHPTAEQENRAVARTVRLVRRLGLQDRVEYISFSLNICKRLVALTPQSSIAYLNGELSPRALQPLGIRGIDYHYTVIDRHPEWVDEARRLGMTVNVWTVDKPEDIRRMIDRKVDFITTNRPVETRELLKR